MINKTYNIEQFAETLQQEIELSKEYDKYDGIVKLDILTAYDILEVLKEIHKREQKHQTIESALVFDEKESKESKIPSCFGNYEEEDDWEDSCDECMYEKECKKSCMNKKKQREDICVNE